MRKFFHSPLNGSGIICKVFFPFSELRMYPYQSTNSLCLLLAYALGLFECSSQSIPNQTLEKIGSFQDFRNPHEVDFRCKYHYLVCQNLIQRLVSLDHRERLHKFESFQNQWDHQLQYQMMARRILLHFLTSFLSNEAQELYFELEIERIECVPSS